MPRATMGQRKGRSREAATSYAVGHRIRVEILAVLHEHPASAKELATEVRQPLSKVGHHIEELLADKSIEVARTEMVGNVEQTYYRVARLPEYTSEQFANLSPEEKQTTFSLIIQSAMVEVLASLWSGKLVEDPLVMLAWNRLGLDERGREDLAEEQDRSWVRIHEIAAEATARASRSGEELATHVVTSMGYRRSRTSAPALGQAGCD